MAEHQRDPLLEKKAIAHVERLRMFYRNIIFFVILIVILVFRFYIPEKYDNPYLFIIIIWGAVLLYQGLRLLRNFWIFSDQWENKQIAKFLHHDHRKAKKVKSKGSKGKTKTKTKKSLKVSK